MTLLVAGTSIGSIMNGRLFPKQNKPGRLMVFGSGVLTLGCLLTLTFTADSPSWWVLLSMSLCGIGLGFMLPNFTLFMQMLAEQRDVGGASALVQTTRTLGSALGTALVGCCRAHLNCDGHENGARTVHPDVNCDRLGLFTHQYAKLQ